jgi:hypothetical protein
MAGQVRAVLLVNFDLTGAVFEAIHGLARQNSVYLITAIRYNFQSM